MSRVGGNAQIKAMKQVAGTLRLDLAQYRAMEAFAQFASDLDEATQHQLARGQRLVEVLKQGQYVPINVEEQVAMIFAGTKGYLDPLPVPAIKRYEQELVSWLKSEKPEILKDVISRGKLDDDLEKRFHDALKAFADIFSVDEN